ncbi:hypothetical protein U1Q18_032551, partial [Sarracenia purpurea var. burkii]
PKRSPNSNAQHNPPPPCATDVLPPARAARAKAARVYASPVPARPCALTLYTSARPCTAALLYAACMSAARMPDQCYYGLCY